MTEIEWDAEFDVEDMDNAVLEYSPNGGIRILHIPIVRKKFKYKLKDFDINKENEL